MDKNGFKAFCKKEFEARGFKKIKNVFYLTGSDLLCGIELQKSNYGACYYVNYYYYIGMYENSADYPTHYDSDIYDRISVMSKTQTVHGKRFLTAMIEYEKYTEEELKPYFDRAFEEIILPPVQQGKKVILDNLGKTYFLTLHKDEVLKKLES